MLTAWLTSASCAASTAQPPPPAPPPSPRAQAKTKPKAKVRIDVLAAQMRDDLECQKAVSKLANRSKRHAWALIKACINQDKFRNLRMVLTEPWRSFLSAEPRSLQWVAHLIAIRGADFRSDLPLVRSERIGVSTLREVMNAPSDHKARPVLFRGYVISRQLMRDGFIRMRIAEVGRITVDKKVEFEGVVYKYGSNEKRMLTGRLIEARTGPLPMLVREGNEFVFLGTFSKLTQNNSGEDVAQLQLIDVFRRGVVLPDY